MRQGFPCGSGGKESACNAGDVGLIPGLGRSLGEGKGYPFQYPGLENSRNCIVNVQLSSVQFSRSVVSNSLQHCELQPTRLLCLWNFPGKNAGVGCHALPSPGDLCDLGIKPTSPALQVDSLPAEPQGKPPPLFLSILWLLTIDLALHLLSLCPYKSCQSTLICFCLSSSYP